jgi:hypothetical protein
MGFKLIRKNKVCALNYKERIIGTLKHNKITTNSIKFFLFSLLLSTTILLIKLSIFGLLDVVLLDTFKVGLLLSEILFSLS